MPGFSVHGILQARIGVGCLAFFQGIFLTQGLSPGLMNCRQILYCLNHQGNLMMENISNGMSAVLS